MSLGEALRPEFEIEMAVTRTTLERVPDDKWDFKPHEKSGTLGWLAGHVATIPFWPGRILQDDSLDVAPVDSPPLRPPRPASRQQCLEMFDQAVAGARQAIAGASDERLNASWTLLRAGQPMFSHPRILVLRRMFLNHLIHHRAQLGVYLRLCGVAVPATYGPSADENPFG